VHCPTHTKHKIKRPTNKNNFTVYCIPSSTDIFTGVSLDDMLDLEFGFVLNIPALTLATPTSRDSVGLLMFCHFNFMHGYPF